MLIKQMVEQKITKTDKKQRAVKWKRCGAENIWSNAIYNIVPPRERETKSMSWQEVQAGSHRPQHQLWGPVSTGGGGREKRGGGYREADWKVHWCQQVSTGVGEKREERLQNKQDGEKIDQRAERGKEKERTDSVVEESDLGLSLTYWHITDWGGKKRRRSAVHSCLVPRMPFNNPKGSDITPQVHVKAKRILLGLKFQLWSWETEEEKQKIHPCPSN